MPTYRRKWSRLKQKAAIILIREHCVARPLHPVMVPETVILGRSFFIYLIYLGGKEQSSGPWLFLPRMCEQYRQGATTTTAPLGFQLRGLI
jgi:hypothetical protein